jgi:hypothetical protein
MTKPSPLDARIVAPATADFIRGCQARVTCHLGEGAALAGAYLRHRLSADADLFVHDRAEHRILVAALPEIGESLGVEVLIDRDAGGFVRARLAGPDAVVEVDIVHEAIPDLEQA